MIAHFNQSICTVLYFDTEGSLEAKGFNEGAILGQGVCTAIPDWLAVRQTQLICEATDRKSSKSTHIEGMSS